MMLVQGALADPLLCFVLTVKIQQFQKCIHRDRTFQSDLLKLHVGVEWLEGECRKSPCSGIVAWLGSSWQHLCVGCA